MIVFFLGVVHTNWKGGSSQAIWRETYHRNVEAFQAYSLSILWTCTQQIHKTANIFQHQYFTLLQNISGYYFVSANQSKYNLYHHIGSYWHVHLSTSYYRFMVPLINTSSSSYRFECFRIFQDISLHPKSLQPQSKSKTTPSPVRRRSSFDVDVAVAATGASTWWWWKVGPHCWGDCYPKIGI